MAELVSELTKVAGEVKRPSKTLTGRASLQRLVCAPERCRSIVTQTGFKFQRIEYGDRDHESNE